ncbi:hypothetical protein [Rhodopirellula bahusiensis]|uniref:Uncharacterized protein n=1 Tax=Rhodopirellula bahusiensis TaxID=2014065 RepID=A0A2G1W3N3_9BACT|nr:hypothetical protein [Rhodopirellula bahusiensis]PHQ33470.1 hypothetical protein CEE69_20865 [Rhodopirellula bahusiensis]
MGQGETNARTNMRHGFCRDVPRPFYDPFAIAVWRSLTGFIVCVFGVTNALAQTSEKIVVLPRFGTPSCELSESVIRFRIESEADSADAEPDPTEATPVQSTVSGRLDIRSADTNALIGQVAISPDTVSEPITITEPGIYDVQMRVPRDHSGWQRWLRLDSLTESDSMDVARSWTVVALPARLPTQTGITKNTTSPPAAKKLPPCQVMTRIDMATLRSWCSNAKADSSESEHSLLNWKWRSEGAPISRDAMIWQARSNCLQREIKSIRDNGVDAIVLPIAKPSPGGDSDATASGLDPIDDALLVRLAAEQMIQAEGQVWLEPPRLPCGAPVDELVDTWNQFWGDGLAIGFVVRWQSDTIQCRQCGHHHGTDALLPIIADLNDQHLMLVEDAIAESPSAEDANEAGLPTLQQTLAEIRRSQPNRMTGQVWLVRDHRRQPPPRLNTHFQVVDSRGFGPFEGVWLGYQSSGVDSAPPSAAKLDAVMAEEMDDQWIGWWDEVSRSVSRPNSPPVTQFVLADVEMLDTPSGTAACYAWKHWSDQLATVVSEASAGKHQSIDGLVTVSVHPTSHCLVLINRAPWPMSVTLTTTESTNWKTEPGKDASQLMLTKPEQTALGARLKLPPRQMVICQSETPLPRKLAWTGYVSDPAAMIPRITEQVTMIVEHVGLLSELDRLPCGLNTATDVDETQTAPTRSSIDRWNPGRVIQASTTLLRSPKAATPPSVLKAPESLLSNGGFEQKSLPDANARLGIPSWMHAQHPADAVKLDPRSAFRGEQSVRLAARDSSGTQAWLISKNIATPDAGRVAISMALRGLREPTKELSKPDGTTEPIGNPMSRGPAWTQSNQNRPAASLRDGAAAEPSKTLTLRVALEGSLDGQPCRHWREVEVPVDGKWQDSTVVLEWLNIDVENTRDLRVTIDNLSDGIIWVDDVFVSDWFASRAERAEIQSLAYLAVQGLQRNDIKAAAQLLNQFWAKQLLQFAKRRSVDPRRAEVNRSLVEPVFGRGGSSTVAVTSVAVGAHELGAPLAAINTAGLTSNSPMPTNALAPTPDPNRPPDTATNSQPVVDSPMQRPGVTGRIRNWLPQPLRF